MSASLTTICLLATLGMTTPTGWPELEPGLAYKMVKVQGTAGLTGSRLHVFRLDLAHYKLRAIDARTPRRARASIQTLSGEASATLLINGTYFDERDRPLGLLINDDKTLNPLRRADWGVFHVTKGRAALVHTRDWKGLPKEPLGLSHQRPLHHPESQ